MVAIKTSCMQCAGLPGCARQTSAFGRSSTLSLSISTRFTAANRCARGCGAVKRAGTSSPRGSANRWRQAPPNTTAAAARWRKVRLPGWPMSIGWWAGMATDTRMLRCFTTRRSTAAVLPALKPPEKSTTFMSICSPKNSCQRLPDMGWRPISCKKSGRPRWRSLFDSFRRLRSLA